jgi:hypothetical protein
MEPGERGPVRPRPTPPSPFQLAGTPRWRPARSRDGRWRG